MEKRLPPLFGQTGSSRAVMRDGRLFANFGAPDGPLRPVAVPEIAVAPWSGARFRPRPLEQTGACPKLTLEHFLFAQNRRETAIFKKKLHLPPAAVGSLPHLREFAVANSYISFLFLVARSATYRVAPRGNISNSRKGIYRICRRQIYRAPQGANTSPARQRGRSLFFNIKNNY